MYLRGLSATFQPFDFKTSADYAQAEACVSQGGTPDLYWSPVYNGPYYMGVKATFTSCRYPPPSTQPPANVTVNTTTQTQVSPQISPSFVQQDQPQGSPVTTGAVSAPTGPSQTQNDAAMFQQLLQQQADEQARRDALMLEAFKAATGGAQQPTPAQTMEPAPQDASTDVTSAPVATVAEPPLTRNYLPIVAIMLIAGGVIIYRNRKRKGK